MLRLISMVGCTGPSRRRVHITDSTPNQSTVSKLDDLKTKLSAYKSNKPGEIRDIELNRTLVDLQSFWNKTTPDFREKALLKQIWSTIKDEPLGNTLYKRNSDEFKYLPGSEPLSNSKHKSDLQKKLLKYVLEDLSKTLFEIKDCKPENVRVQSISDKFKVALDAYRTCDISEKKQYLKDIKESISDFPIYSTSPTIGGEPGEQSSASQGINGALGHAFNTNGINNGNNEVTPLSACQGYIALMRLISRA